MLNLFIVKMNNRKETAPHSPIRVSILNPPPAIQSRVFSRKKKVDTINYKINDVIDGRYTVVEELGKGGYGKIFKAKCSVTKSYCAVKVTKDFTSWQTEKTMYENILHSSSPHRSNFAFFLGSGAYRCDNYLALELLGPNLDTLLDESPEQSFSMEIMLRLFPLLLEPVLSLHSLGLVHSDIKPNNFVVRDFNPYQCSPKFVLIDFGFTTKFEPYVSESAIPLIRPGTVRGHRTYASEYAHVYNRLSKCRLNFFITDA